MGGTNQIRTTKKQVMDAYYKRALQLDQADELASFKEEFVEGETGIYLDGNSLGKLPKQTLDAVKNTLEDQWGNQLITSWNKHWLELPKRIAAMIAQLLGTTQDCVYVGESTSVNLYKLLSGLLKSEHYPMNLSTDSFNFPSDHYILQGLASTHKARFHYLDYAGQAEANIEQLKRHMADFPGIVCLSMVSYKSAYLYPVKELNDWAQQHQSIIVWDLSHAVGICDINCEDLGIVAAVGCTYKYLNGGPGAPAFLMLDSSLIAAVHNPIQGWFGHQNPFDFDTEYQPHMGIDRFANGTPSILSMSALEKGVELTVKATTKAIAQKNKKQMAFLIELAKAELLAMGYQLEVPHSLDRMGGHLSISHPMARSIVEVLKKGTDNYPPIVTDFRPPNLIRMGVASLYCSFEDLVTTIAFLKAIIVTDLHKNVKLDHQIVP